MSYTDLFGSAFRDYAVDGVPSSGAHNVVKSEVRAIGSALDVSLQALGTGSAVAVAFETEADAQADLAHAEDTLAVVYADPTPSLNDIWIKVGGTGLGGWIQSGLMQASGGVFSVVAETFAELEPQLDYSANKLAYVWGDDLGWRRGIYRKLGGVGSGGWDPIWHDLTDGYNAASLANYPNSVEAPGSIAVGTGLRFAVTAAGGIPEGNTVVGHFAGHHIENGWANTCIGWHAGMTMSDKDTVTTYSAGSPLGNVGNVYIGYNCAPLADGALDNTIVGTSGGLNLTTGMDNAAIGINTLRSIAGGSENAALGHGTLQHVVGSGDFTTGTGHRLTAVGDMAGRFLTSAANKTGGKASVYIGAQTASASNTAFNETVIGYLAQGLGDNTVVIGNSSVTQQRLQGNICGGNGALSIPPLAPFHAYNSSSAGGVLVDGFRASRPGASTAYAFMSFDTGSAAYFGGVYPGTKAELIFRTSDGTNHIDAITVRVDGRVDFIKTVRTTPLTVATLPAAATAGAGARAFVTDSTVAAAGNFGAAVVGGGANGVPVYSTGASWLIG